jgi:hypothetical protein
MPDVNSHTSNKHGSPRRGPVVKRDRLERLGGAPPGRSGGGATNAHEPSKPERPTWSRGAVVAILIALAALTVAIIALTSDDRSVSMAPGVDAAQSRVGVSDKPAEGKTTTATSKEEGADAPAKSDGPVAVTTHMARLERAGNAEATITISLGRDMLRLHGEVFMPKTRFGIVLRRGDKVSLVASGRAGKLDHTTFIPAGQLRHYRSIEVRRVVTRDGQQVAVPALRARTNKLLDRLAEKRKADK